MHMAERFEKQHRQVRYGDVVLFRSDYSDKYYRPLPEGRRFIAEILDRKAPGSSSWTTRSISCSPRFSRSLFENGGEPVSGSYSSTPRAYTGLTEHDALTA